MAAENSNLSHDQATVREERRRAALAGYKILDTPREQVFDDLVRLASVICAAPISLISLVDAERQWFKAETGLDGIRETPLDYSICVHAIKNGDMFEIPDATKDERFADNPLISGDPHLRFYSAAILRTPEGLPLGTLCVLDFKPRALDEAQKFALSTLAKQVMMQFELRRALQAEHEAKKETQRRERFYATVLSNTPDFVYVIGVDKRFSYANKALLTMWGKNWDEVAGKNLYELGYPDWHAAMHEREVEEVQATKKQIRGEVHFNGTNGRRLYDYIFSPIFNEKGEVDAIAGTTRDVTEQREIEKALRFSEERRALALEASDFIGTWDWDIVSDLVIAEERFARAFSIEPERAAKGVPVAEFIASIHPEDIERVSAQIQTVVKQGGKFTSDYRLVQADGSVRWILVQGRVELNAEGRAVRFPGVAIDITERKEADEKLRESERQLQEITDAMPQQVWTARPDGQLDYVNQHTRDYVGDIKMADGVVQWLGVVHPDDVRQSLEAWGRSVVTGEYYETQQRIFHKETGQYRWNLSRARPLYGPKGTIVKWFGTNTDIQDERSATDLVRDAQAHLSLMMESAEDYAIVSLDKRGSIMSWNKGAERLFGYEAAEIVGRPINTIFPPEERINGKMERDLDEVALNGRAKTERWNMRKNGERFFVNVVTTTMLDEDGKLKGFIKIARDLTQERAAQQALIAARNAAEAANIAKTEFLANMSHEIRTPMNAVIGLANILSVSKPLTERQAEFIKTLQLSADSLLELINDLLDISKIEARTVELEKVPFNLTQLLQEVVSMMGVRVREKGLTFTGEGESAARHIYLGDPTRVRQIVLNLCSNAIKFTHQGGVHIRVHCEPTDKALVEKVFIIVKDTGIGIPADKIESIFQKFVQADSSVNRKYGGTGLGLAITKTLTAMMGGTLQVESTVGQGSTFTVCLPLEIAPIEAVNVPPLSDVFRHAVETGGKKHILLVEDYAANVMVAMNFLEHFGYSCDVASNGVEAVEMARSGDYAAVLMDVQMHGMNGLEATRLIRQRESQENLQRLPIIGMTAHALAGDRERCLAVGMDEYIAKPFDPAELREKLALLVKGGVEAV